METFIEDFVKDQAKNPEIYRLYDAHRMSLLDENGKDMSHPMYGADREAEKNGNWKGGISLDRNAYMRKRYHELGKYVQKGHGARLGLKRGKYKPRVKK